MSSASLGMMANPRPRTLLVNGAVMPNDSRTYVVCGVQRGGTSMVGAVLGALGIDMGAVGFNYEDAAFFASEQDLDGYIARRNQSAVWDSRYRIFLYLSTTLRSDCAILFSFWCFATQWPHSTAR